MVGMRCWATRLGYEKILAGSIDEKNGRGNKTRLLRIEAGSFSTKPFVHEYWEEVFLLSGDLIVGNDAQGKGGEPFPKLHLRGSTTGCLSWTVHNKGRPSSAGNALF
jgi:hypothetical protein